MNRNDRIQPLLQSWVDHRLATASDDLLAEVMREVETVSQRRTAAPSWLSLSHVTAGVTVAAVMVMLATAIGLYVANQTGHRPPVPGPAATPTATPWQVNATPAQIVTYLMEAWNGSDERALTSFYAEGARVWLVEENRSIAAGDEIRAWMAEPTHDESARGELWGAGTVLQQGPYLAALMWASNHGSAWSKPDSVVWVLDLTEDNLVQRQYVFSVTDDGMFGWDGPSDAEGSANDEIVNALDTALEAMNSHDGAAHAASFTDDGAWRLAVAADPWSEQYIGRDAIAATTVDRAGIDFHVIRGEKVLDVGSLILYPWTMSGTLGNAEGFAVIEEGGNYQAGQSWIAAEWVVGR
jgi:hypothetical protein